MLRTVSAISALALLFTLAPVGSLDAQESRTAPPGELQALSPGSQVRLTSTGVDLERGTYLGFESQSLLVRDDRDSYEVPLRTLRSLHVRSHATVEAAWKGAIIGAAAGAVWGVIVDGTDCPTPSTCVTEYWPRVPIDAAIGLGVGSVVGAGIGRLITRWKRVFP